MTTVPSLRWEDLYVGRAFGSPGRTVTESDVVAFAGLTGDFSELHTSEEYARHSAYGRRVAHGLLGLSFAHGLMWPRTGELRDCAIAFLGISDWRFVAPIFLGDTIRVAYTIAELRDSASNPERAIVTFDVEILKQDGSVVQRGRKALLVSKKVVPAVSPDGRAAS